MHLLSAIEINGELIVTLIGTILATLGGQKGVEVARKSWREHKKDGSGERRAELALAARLDDLSAVARRFEAIQTSVQSLGTSVTDVHTQVTAILEWLKDVDDRVNGIDIGLTAISNAHSACNEEQRERIRELREELSSERARRDRLYEDRLAERDKIIETTRQFNDIVGDRIGVRKAEPSTDSQRTQEIGGSPASTTDGSQS